MTEENLVFIRENEVDLIFSEVKSFSVDLSSDPSTLGPMYLQELTVLVRNRTNRVTYHINEMTQRSIYLRRSLANYQALYRMKSNELLTNSELVRAQKSIKDREAVISVLLQDDYRIISSLERQEHELSAVLDSLRLIHRELKDTAADVRNQVKIIEVELKTKAHFGDDWDNKGNTTPEARKFHDDVSKFLEDSDLTDKDSLL